MDLTKQIGSKVRELRLARRWSQAELGRELDLSQSRLSELERGAGSFSAEQFLTILRLFNVPVSFFEPARRTTDRTTSIQNALARLGATELRESDAVFPSERLEETTDVAREAILAGDARLLLGLGPVLVAQGRHLDLSLVQGQLASAGKPRRLPWLVANVIEAILRSDLPRTWERRAKSVGFLLGFFLDAQMPPRPDVVLDILDRDIRSKRTLDAVIAESSPISRQWRIATTLQPDEFVAAFKASHGTR